MKIPILRLILCLTVLTLPTCGGGRGGGGQNGGNVADVSLRVAPDTIDTGDRTKVTIRLTNIESEGVPALLIKILHPSALSFLGDTVLLSRNNLEDAAIAPILASADEAGYVVIYITRPTIGEDNREATLTFTMQGIESVNNGEVSVDVDVIDTDTRPLFRVSNPQFLALATTSIRILED